MNIQWERVRCYDRGCYIHEGYVNGKHECTIEPGIKNRYILKYFIEMNREWPSQLQYKSVKQCKLTIEWIYKQYEINQNNKVSFQ